jgi:prepilin-type N-terminal cleavage/methylation domain-containing protein
MSTTNRDGFTLIELLIVVVIIGILAAIAIPKFSSPREKAFVSAMTADLRNLASLQEVHHNANFTYSTDQAALDFTTSDGVTVTIAEATGRAGPPPRSISASPASPARSTTEMQLRSPPATVESKIECSY